MVHVEQNKRLDIIQTRRREKMSEMASREFKIFDLKLISLLRVKLFKLLASKGKDQSQHHQPASVFAFLCQFGFARIRCFQAKVEHASVEQRHIHVNSVEVSGYQGLASRLRGQEITNGVSIDILLMEHGLVARLF